MRQPSFLEDIYQELQAVPILSPAVSHPCLKWAQIENVLFSAKKTQKSSSLLICSAIIGNLRGKIRDTKTLNLSRNIDSLQVWVDVSRFSHWMINLSHPNHICCGLNKCSTMIGWFDWCGICCMTSCETDEKRATKAKFVAQSRPALYFSQKLSSNPQQMFLRQDKLITQGEKHETWTQNLLRNNVARQVEGFCIPYFAAF